MNKLPDKNRTPRARAKAKLRLAESMPGPLNSIGFEPARALKDLSDKERDAEFAASKHRDHRVVIGQKSHFYSPAYAVADAINEALDPERSEAPRRFVPRRRKRSIHGHVLINADCRLTTYRYGGWPAAEVAEVNPRFLEWILSIKGACANEAVFRRARGLLLRLRVPAG